MNAPDPKNVRRSLRTCESWSEAYLTAIQNHMRIDSVVSAVDAGEVTTAQVGEIAIPLLELSLWMSCRLIQAYKTTDDPEQNMQALGNEIRQQHDEIASFADFTVLMGKLRNKQ